MKEVVRRSDLTGSTVDETPVRILSASDAKMSISAAMARCHRPADRQPPRGLPVSRGIIILASKSLTPSRTDHNIDIHNNNLYDFESADSGIVMSSIHRSIQEKTMRVGPKVETTMETTIGASIEEVFDFIAAEDVLPKILTGYGLLPAVVRTSGNTGPWDKPGSSRTVHLADDTTSREEVTDYKRPSYFAYRTSDYTFALRYIATAAEGQWWFTEHRGQTNVRWTYTFAAKGAATAILLSIFARSQWAGYMRVCLENTHRHFDDEEVAQLQVPVS